MGFVGRELAEEAEKPAINYIRNTGMKYRLPLYLETPVCNEPTLHFKFANFCKNSPSELVDQKKKKKNPRSGNKS